MTAEAILEFVAILLGVAGVAKSVSIVVRSVTAERDWSRATEHLTTQRAKLLADLARERALVTPPMRRAYLPETVREFVRDLNKDHLLRDRSAHVLESALSQPSEVGRQAYADKLVRKATSGVLAG